MLSIPFEIFVSLLNEEVSIFSDMASAHFTLLSSLILFNVGYLYSPRTEKFDNKFRNLYTYNILQSIINS